MHYVVSSNMAIHTVMWLNALNNKKYNDKNPSVDLLYFTATDTTQHSIKFELQKTQLSESHRP